MKISSWMIAGAARELAFTTQAIARSVERLASGSRLTHDPDYVLSIATNLQTRIGSLGSAHNNILRAFGLLQTAGSSIDSMIDIIHSMREIAIRASSDTLTADERNELDKEIQSLMSDYRRLSTDTEYDGIHLLDGSFMSRFVQVGDQVGDQIELKLDDLSASKQFNWQTSVTETETVIVPGSPGTTIGTGAFSFGTTITFAASSDPWSLAGADFNGDGKKDLAILTGTTDLVSIRIGNGDGTFSVGTTLTQAAGSGGRRIISADLNGDGKLDLAWTNNVSDEIAIRFSNGDGTFSVGTTITGINSPSGLAADDLDGDGDKDLVFSNNSGNATYSYLNNGSGVFSFRQSLATGGSNPWDVQLTDFNGDGNLDMIVAAINDDAVRIFKGNGDGYFAASTVFSMNDGSKNVTYGVAVGDFNGDGKKDFVSNGGNNVMIQLGNGNLTFATSATFTLAAGSIPNSFFVGDFNADGNQDIAFTNRDSNIVNILLGNGNGTFALSSTLSLPAASTPRQIIGLDFNGDGVLDLATANQDGDTSSILIGSTTTTPPSPDSETEEETTRIIDFRPSSVNVKTSSSASDLILLLDHVLDNLISSRSLVSTQIERFEFASDLSERQIQNLQDAHDLESNVDMVEEIADLTYLQILENAQVAVLAHSKLQAQVVLQLLKDL